MYLFSNNLTNDFATDDIISLSSEISKQINLSSLLKNWEHVVTRIAWTCKPSGASEFTPSF
jgi:hypothetical protein